MKALEPEPLRGFSCAWCDRVYTKKDFSQKLSGKSSMELVKNRPRFDHGNGQDLGRVQHDMQRHLKYYHAIHAFDQIDQIPGHRVQG